MFRKKSRPDALKTSFSVCLDIFYPSNFGGFEKNGLFQHPQAFTLTIPRNHLVSVNSGAEGLASDLADVVKL